jgi:hypothetical protein
MGKYIREIDGVKYVGVVISPGFGAGWSTWNPEVNPCDGEFIEFLLEKGTIYKGEDEDEEWGVRIDKNVVHDYWTYTRGYKDIYCGGVENGFEIQWIKEGSFIRITEYDGAESIEYLSSSGFFTV